MLDSLKTPHLFRFAITSLCTWARPQAIIDFDPATQVDWNGGLIDLAPIGWVPTNKRRPRQPLTGCLARWLPVWNKEDEAWQATALAEGRSPPELGLIVSSLRHFMADQVEKLFRNVPREDRSLWMGHVVRDGSRTTASYESDDPEMLTGVALATDCVIALLQQRCDRPLFAVDVLLTNADLQAIGVRAIPETLRKQRIDGGGCSRAKLVSKSNNREFFNILAENRLSERLQWSPGLKFNRDSSQLDGNPGTFLLFRKTGD